MLRLDLRGRLVAIKVAALLGLTSLSVEAPGLASAAEDSEVTPAAVSAADWSSVDTWRSPISGDWYVVKRDLAEAWESETSMEIRLEGPAGRFASTDAVIAAEISDSGLAPHLFKAEARLREAFLRGASGSEDLIIALSTQPLASVAPTVWARHRPGIDLVERLARANSVPSAAIVLGERIERLREAARAEIFALSAKPTALLQAVLVGVLDRMGIASRPHTQIYASVIATVPYSQLAEVTALRLVGSVHALDVSEALLENSAPTTGKLSFANAGIDGGAADVAIVDTGVDLDHPALKAHFSESIVAVKKSDAKEGCWDDDDSTVDDYGGHGTHVAGIVASTDTTHKGMAPNPKSGIIAVKAAWKTPENSGCGGTFLDENWSKGIQSALTGNLRAEVINGSFGGERCEGDGAAKVCSGPLGNSFGENFVDEMVASLDVPGIFAAGNGGNDGNVKHPSSIAFPSSAHNAVSVGNANDNDTGPALEAETGVKRKDDTLVPSSGRGPTGDGRLKPDVVAPGAGIQSANHEHEGLGSNFVSKTGTSMASPHVAGAAALAEHAGIGGALRFKTQLIHSANFFELRQGPANGTRSESPSSGDYGSVGPWNYDVGHGYMDLSTVKRIFTGPGSEDRYQTARLNESVKTIVYRWPTPWWGNDAATLVWNRINRYEPTFRGTQAPGTPDLTLRVYRISDGHREDIGRNFKNNWERVWRDPCSGRPQPCDRLLQEPEDAYLVVSGTDLSKWEPNADNSEFAGVEFGVGVSGSLTRVEPADLGEPIVTVPRRFVPGRTATVSATITNEGGVAGYDAELTIDTSEANGFELVEGQITRTQTIDGGSTATYTWKLRAPTSGNACGVPFDIRVHGRWRDLFDGYRNFSDVRSPTEINCAPTVTLHQPDDTLPGAFWGGARNIVWSGSDANDDSLSYTVTLSEDEGRIEPTVVCKTNATSCAFDTSPYADGGGYRIEVVASDGDATGSDRTDPALTIDNTAPDVHHRIDGDAGVEGWWGQEAPRVDFDCRDELSPIDGMSRRHDLAGTWQAHDGQPFIVAGEGDRVVDLKCVDRAGNNREQRVELKIDLTDPQVELTADGRRGGGGWYTSPVVLSVDCRDDRSGPLPDSRKLYVESQAGEEGGTYGGPTLFDREGSAVARALCLDRAHNSGGSKAHELNLDLSPPDLGLRIIGERGQSDWWISPVQAQVTCTDEHSGVDWVAYQSTVGSGPYDGPVRFDTDGSHYVRVDCADVARHQSDESESPINIDTTPPELRIALDGTPGDNGWFRSAVTVTVECRDLTSGVSKTDVTVNGSTSTYGGPFILDEGIHALEASCYDRAGNASSSGARTVQIDVTHPEIQCSATPERIWPPDRKFHDIAVDVQTHDDLSGVADFMLSAVDSNETMPGKPAHEPDVVAWEFGEPDTAGQLRADKNIDNSQRAYSIWYTASDIAGNESACSTTVRVAKASGGKTPRPASRLF